MKKLSGMTSASAGGDHIMKSLQNIDGISSPLPANFIPDGDFSLSPPFAVFTNAVYIKLSSLNSTKAQGPDGVPAWLLKKNANCLSKPITDILNRSFQESRLPPTWKKADVVPVLKERPPTNFPYTNSIKSCRGLCCREVRQAGCIERN